MLKKILKKIFKRNTTEIKLIPKDEFIEHIKFVNPGFLHPGNLYCFDYVIKNIPNDLPIIEIGSFCGLSTNIINYFLNKHQKKNILFNADIWKLYSFRENKKIGNSSITHSEYREQLIKTYKLNVSFFSRNSLPKTIEIYSDIFFESWMKKEVKETIFEEKVQLGGQISFAYLDGSHLYDQVKKDFLNIDKILVKGGFILFDDSNEDVYKNDDCEVSKLIAEILSEKKYETVIKKPNYLLKKIQ